MLGHRRPCRVGRPALATGQQRSPRVRPSGEPTRLYGRWPQGLVVYCRHTWAGALESAECAFRPSPLGSPERSGALLGFRPCVCKWPRRPPRQRKPESEVRSSQRNVAQPPVATSLSGTASPVYVSGPEGRQVFGSGLVRRPPARLSNQGLSAGEPARRHLLAPQRWRGCPALGACSMERKQRVSRCTQVPRLVQGLAPHQAIFGCRTLGVYTSPPQHAGLPGCECLCLCTDRCVCVCVCVWVCSGTLRGDVKRAALPSRVSSPAAGMLRTRDQRPVLPRWALELLRFYTAWSGQDCDRGCAVRCCIGARPARPAGAPPTGPVFQCGCRGEGRPKVRGAPIRVPPHLASLARPQCRLGRNELDGRIE